MTKQSRWIVRTLAVVSLCSAVALWWYDRKVLSDAQAAARGEEVYSSHDCTDCHLPAHVLRQKAARGEPGLIRSGRSFPEVQLFLAKDTRHHSYLLMSQNDRDDLVHYLRSLLRR